MKYVKYLVAVLTVIIALSAVNYAPESITESDFLLDTYVSVTVYGKDGETAAKHALSYVRELDKILSTFHSDSDVSRINRAGKNVPTKVSDACFSVIERALFLSEQTGGAFDITIKPVMDLWGFGSDVQAVPSQNTIDEALQYVDYRNILLDDTEKTVTLLKEGIAIDLGGIAKGYCADKAANVLLECGVENAYLDFGGNVVTIGERPLGLFDRIRHQSKTRPFVVGIQDPNGSRGSIVGTHVVQDARCAVVTSGGYERNFKENGQTYHHILNPFTGKQPQNGILSVTVIGASSMDCDALSTALFVSGEECLNGLTGIFEKVLFVMDNGEIKTMVPQGES